MDNTQWLPCRPSVRPGPTRGYPPFSKAPSERALSKERVRAVSHVTVTCLRVPSRLRCHLHVRIQGQAGCLRSTRLASDKIQIYLLT